MSSFIGVLAIPAEQLERNEKYSESLGLPDWGSFEAKGPLAIVGGGHSINTYKYTLQSWPGTVWAVNRTFGWCKENGINGVFFSFDANPSVAGMVEGAQQAILGNRVDPEVYKRLAGQQIWVGSGNDGGTTSVGAAIIGAVECGFENITLFGCEGCHQPNSSHAFTHYESDDELVVWVDGMHFYCTPQLYTGAAEIAQMIKQCPILKERSGGLLRAMVESNTEPLIVGAAPGLYEKLFVE